METAGFYKLEDGSLIYAPNFVVTSSYSIFAENRYTLVLPLDGWYWFDSDIEAKSFFNIPIEDDEIIEN